MEGFLVNYVWKLIQIPVVIENVFCVGHWVLKKAQLADTKYRSVVCVDIYMYSG